MPRLGKFIQDPDERKRYTIDYSEWLDTGELLTSVMFDVAPAGLTIDGYQIDDTKKIVSFFASGGDDGETYEVLVTVQTDGGQIKQDEVLFSVRAL